MRIGILSMQRVRNYGSVLQAYSLKMMIEEITGEEVFFLDPIYNSYYDANMPVVDDMDYEGNNDYRLNLINHMLKKIVNHYIDKKFCKEIIQFQNKQLKLNDNNNKINYDLVIEGSDEVFKCAKRIYKNLYGEVLNTKKLITYAAACGSAEITGISQETLPLVKEIMKNFDSMSVRDIHTSEYVSKLYDGIIYRHMDPVLMGNLYKRKHNDVDIKNYLVIYAYPHRIRKQNEINAIKNYAKKHKLKTVAIGGALEWCDKYIAVSPLNVLDYFYHSNGVVTDTFHGTVFSIINHCNFAVILRKTNQYKLSGLIEEVKLEDRIVKDISQLSDILDKSIDYTYADNYLQKEREKSHEYLQNEINKAR